MTHATTARRLLGYLATYSEAYLGDPPIWTRLIRQHLGSAGQRPAWCFLTMREVADVQLNMVRQSGMPEREITPTFLRGLVADLPALTALGTWQITRGVYHINHTLLRALWETPISGDLPGEIFQRLPEWCVYVTTPLGATHGGRSLLGFWAHLDPDPRGLELRLLPDIQPNDGQPLPPWMALAIPLGGTLEQGVQTYFGGPDAPRELYDWAQGAISCLLYLCSEAAEYEGAAPRRPAERVIRRAQYGGAGTPGGQEWVMGSRLGARLREVHAGTGGNAQGREKSTHLRRPHWQAVWIGKLGQQQRAARWIPPLIVRADRLEEERPVVIRRS